MTTLGEFHSLVKEEAKKGARLDTVVVGAVRRAAVWFERNYSFSYMDRYVSFVLDPGASEPRVAPLDGTVKAIHFVKRLDVDSPERRWLVERVAPEPIAFISTRAPDKYWVDDHQWLWFNNIPDREYTFHMSYVAYSVWPTDLDAEHWLLSYGEDVMLAKTMMLMAPGQREPAWLELYASMYSEGLVTLMNADAELKYHNVHAHMRYKPDFVDDPRLE